MINFTLNTYGKLLCYCCILNGRNNSVNNYTFTGVQGLPVVDYCLIPYEYLDMFDKFTVTTVSDLINNAGVVDEIQRSSANPDHSLLSWSLKLRTYTRIETTHETEQF